MMGWTDIIIRKTLEKIEPTLDLVGADIKLLQLCLEDFKNYVIWLEKEGKNKSGKKIDVFPSGEETKQTYEFIEIWTGLWWKKYKERVALQLKIPENQDSLLLQANNHLKSFTMQERIMIVEMITDEFIKNGEICCSKILADSLFKRILGRHSPKIWTKIDKINLIPQLKREVKIVSRVHGHLIFIRIDKRYYRLREFRNDGTTQSL